MLVGPYLLIEGLKSLNLVFASHELTYGDRLCELALAAGLVRRDANGTFRSLELVRGVGRLVSYTKNSLGRSRL